jgi:hypothetical protein
MQGWIGMRGWLVAGLMVMMASTATAQIGTTQPTDASRRIPTLRDQLINGLKATRREEQQWLEEIALLVGNRTLGRDLVSAVFKWARRRNPEHPFPYFERGLRALAQRRRIQLPPFEYRLASGGAKGIQTPRR